MDEKKQTVAQTFRILTTAPMLAALFCVAMWLHTPVAFYNLPHFLLALLFLCVLPLLAYPLQKYFPHFCDKGREGQRLLAMLFAVMGYLLGILSCIASNGTRWELRIYLGYLVCGALILLCNQVFHRRASGHACGATLPVVFLFAAGATLGGFLGSLILVGVYWSSLIMSRHTLPQLIGGSSVAVIIGLVLTFCFSFH